MTEHHGDKVRQGIAAITVCTVGVASSPLFYKLAFATGMHALWVNVFRLLFTAVFMGLVSLFHTKSRRALLKTPKRAFWLTALAGTFLALHLNGWALALALYRKLCRVDHFGNLCSFNGAVCLADPARKNLQRRGGRAGDRDRRRSGYKSRRRWCRAAEREPVRAVCGGDRSAVRAVRPQGAPAGGRGAIYHNHVCPSRCFGWW